jgi:hypothetical protein
LATFAPGRKLPTRAGTTSAHVLIHEQVAPDAAFALKKD